LYNGILRDAVHLLKYRLNSSLANPLGMLMSSRLKRVTDEFPFQAVVPVPLHPQRLRERGFNQALSLARFVSRYHSIPLDRNNLVRSRWTHTQVGLSEDKRKANVKGAFAVRRKKNFHKKHILLVDDVYTSGSTVDECAKVLLHAGARTVQILTLARAA
jgi:ComF family protein